jgi:NTE family protein
MMPNRQRHPLIQSLPLLRPPARRPVAEAQQRSENEGGRPWSYAHGRHPAAAPEVTMADRRDVLRAIGLAAAAPWAATAGGQEKAPRPAGIAFGSGGMHGLAHVGAIRAFQALGARPAVIAGCSAGAIAGGLWAAGRSANEIEALALDESWREQGRWHLPRFGLGRLDRLQELIDARTDSARIETMPIPFVAVATNLVTGRTELLRRGPLAPAIAASASVPVLYEPVRLDGRYLVDGALTAPLPIDAARALGAQAVVAIDVAYRPYEDSVSGIAGAAFQMFHIMVNQLIAEQVRRADYAIRLDVHALMKDGADPRVLIDEGERAVYRAWPALAPLLGA